MFLHFCGVKSVKCQVFLGVKKYISSIPQIPVNVVVHMSHSQNWKQNRGFALMMFPVMYSKVATAKVTQKKLTSSFCLSMSKYLNSCMHLLYIYI